MHRGLVKLALVLLAAALAAVALGFQMTDIGHFTGFAAMGALFVLGAVYALWQARRP